VAARLNLWGIAMRTIYWLIFVAALVIVAALLWWRFMTTHRPKEGIYPAGSKIEDKDVFGGFGKSANYPKDLAGRDWGKAGTVSLIALPDERAEWRGRKGFALRLVNRTDKPVALRACDSCLYLVQEALDSDGNWRAIETLPQEICGNSFHRVFLDKDQYWEFPAPRYSGLFKTRMRFRLDLGKEKVWLEDERSECGRKSVWLPRPGGQVIYSNEFEGSINTSQFVPLRDTE
jgi:hypothetical protein